MDKTLRITTPSDRELKSGMTSGAAEEYDKLADFLASPHDARRPARTGTHGQG